MKAVKEWVESFRKDIATIKAVLDNDKVDAGARKLAAAALNYVVARMDLIPDWEPSIGIADDAMVLRVCVSVAMNQGLDEHLGAETLIEVGRLSNDVEELQKLLGDDLYAKLRKYVLRSADEAVRGRTPEMIVTDAKARGRLYEEVDAELLRMPAAGFADPEAAERQLLSYLKTKLQ